jgi:RsiW-degrading membrane proteinase PrsW (M82 family)
MAEPNEMTAQSRHSVSPLFLLMVVVPPLAMIGLVNRWVPEPPDEAARLAAALKMHNHAAVRDAARKLLEENPTVPAYHLIYVDTFMTQRGENAPPASLLEEYAGWLEHSDPNRRDIGRLVCANIFLKSKQPDSALLYLQQIENPRRAYVRLFEGRALLEQGRIQEARAAFEAEIQNQGNRADAVKELAKLFEDHQDTLSLRQLYENPQVRPFMPAGTVRRLALRCGWPGVYAGAVMLPFRRAAHPVGFLAAFFILLLWVGFLRRLDLFEPEKFRWVILTVLMGMAASFAVFPLGDWLEMLFSLKPNLSAGTDLLYAVVRIGLVEEAVKLLPVLIILRFTKEINESIDYVIYASLGALGFAFLENLLYFDRAGLSVIKERGMICCVGHMFYTSLVMYGVVLARYGRTGTVWRNALFCFLLASLFHGLYDFFLMTRFVWEGLRVAAIGLAFLEVLLYVRILNNSLNQSEYFDETRASALLRLREGLGAGLVAVVMFEYLATALQAGPALTYEKFRGTICFTWLLVFFFASTLGTYNLRRGFWLPWLQKHLQTKRTFIS